MKTEIVKLDEERRLAFGWASVSSGADGALLVDTQGDVLDERTLEDAAIEYVIHSRQAGVMHQKTGVAKLVSSLVFTEDIQKALGISLGKVAWFVGFRVTDDQVWKRIKSGELRAFSIHGRAVRKDF